MPHAPISVKFIETEFDSRPWNLTRDSGPSQEINFIVTSEGFVDAAATQYFGASDSPLVFDDEIVQAEVIPYFVNLFGTLVKKFWLDIDKYILMYVLSIDCEQINWEQWKLKIKFGLPQDNGQSDGGGGGDTGPSDKEDNSNEFTQLSFNCTLGKEKRQTAYLKEIDAITGSSISYPPGPNKYIGVTENGVEGAEVPVRGFSFQIVQYMSPKKLTYAYMRRLSRLVTCINATTFFGFARGSVMCTGAQAGGHLYQNVPVTLEFDVKPNFKFSKTLPTSLAPFEDEVILLSNGKKQIVTTKQYDTYNDPDFADTINNDGMGAGIHSGWSIVEYLYAAQVNVSAKTLIRKPTERLIFLPEEVVYVDFVEFLL